MTVKPVNKKTKNKKHLADTFTVINGVTAVALGLSLDVIKHCISSVSCSRSHCYSGKMTERLDSGSSKKNVVKTVEKSQLVQDPKASLFLLTCC